jgi:putative flippase GtrA
MNVLITGLIVDGWGMPYGYALAAVVTVVPMVTYLLSRFWVFRR